MNAPDTLQVIGRVEALLAKVESLTLRVTKVEKELSTQSMVIRNIRAKLTRYGKALLEMYDRVAG